MRVDRTKALKWLAGYVLDGGGNHIVSLELARARLATAQTRLAEYKLPQLEGDLISVKAFEPVIHRCIAAARARLLAVPSGLAPVLCPGDPLHGFKILEAAMLELLGELRTMLDHEEPLELLESAEAEA